MRFALTRVIRYGVESYIIKLLSIGFLRYTLSLEFFVCFISCELAETKPLISLFLI